MGGRTVSGVNLDRADRLFDWSSVQVVIAGLGMSGFAAADALLDLDACRSVDTALFPALGRLPWPRVLRKLGGLIVAADPAGARERAEACLLYTSPSPRDQRGSRMPSSA